MTAGGGRAPSDEQVLPLALATALRLYNAGDRESARLACGEALARYGAHPALDQLMAVLCQELGEVDQAGIHVERSLAARPGHGPTLIVAAIIRQDLRDYEGAATALLEVLRQQPGHVAARVNLGVVRLEQGLLGDAMTEFGRAYVERSGTFGRIANALTSASTGALWTDPDELRRTLRRQ